MKKTFRSNLVASSIRFWLYVIMLINTILGIVASTTTVFGSVSWDTTTWIVVIGSNTAFILLVFIVQLATQVLQEIKRLREQNEKLIRTRGFVDLLDGRTMMISEFDVETGKLFYENKRAILMSCDTLQEIFEVVKCNSNGDDVLKELGYRVGLAFADRFRRYLKQEFLKVDIELEQQITKWCKFDSNAGFGNFIDKVSITGGKISGEIQVNWSVLTEDRNSSQVNLCGFMEGYFEGVLNRIANKSDRDIRVEHIVCDLDNPGKPNLGCKFSISQDVVAVPA